MSALSFTGDGLIQRFANQLGVLGANAPIALSRALNHTGTCPPRRDRQGPWRARIYTGGRGPRLS